MPSDHVRSVPVGLERALNGQIGRQHRRLCVFGLLEFVFCFLEFVFGKCRAQDKSGECFTTQDINHGFVCLTPNVRGGCETLNQICGHANVLTSLARIHVNRFCLWGHWRLVGDEDALGLEEAPFFGVHHGLACEGLTLRKFSPRRGDQRHSERSINIETFAGVLESF